MYIPQIVRTIKRRLFRKSDGERQIRSTFKRHHGRELEIDSASTFSEKLTRRLIWLNRDGNPLFSQAADKIAARDFVRKRVGEQHLTKLLWSGTDPRQIPYDTLPAKCIIKPSHGSGGVVVYTPEADKEAIVAGLRRDLRTSYYWTAREAHYLPIVPAVVVEEFISDGRPGGPLDYRFWCFEGRPEIIQVDNSSHTINPFYDSAWTPLDLHYREAFENTSIDRPAELDEMLDVASKLAAGFGFVRVDLYNAHGKVLFGEMTFTPVAADFKLSDPEWDARLGTLWTMPD